MPDFRRIWYHATAYFPRKLPRTEAEFLKLKVLMIEIFDIPDETQCWINLSGVIGSTPAHKVRRPYAHLANCMKRLRINAIAQAYKVVMIKKLEERLEVLVKEQNDLAEAESAKNVAPAEQTGLVESKEVATQ